MKPKTPAGAGGGSGDHLAGDASGLTASSIDLQRIGLPGRIIAEHWWRGDGDLTAVNDNDSGPYGSAA